MNEIADGVTLSLRDAGTPTPADRRTALKTMQNEGVKFDSTKPSISMIPRRAILEEAKVMDYGAQKYDRDNWRKGMKWTRYIDAAMRHIQDFNEGEDADPESGLSHLAHARCCLAFLLEYEVTHKELDDRHSSMKEQNDI